MLRLEICIVGVFERVLCWYCFVREGVVLVLLVLYERVLCWYCFVREGVVLVLLVLYVCYLDVTLLPIVEQLSTSIETRKSMLTIRAVTWWINDG